jgi:uncharacterized protein (TIGR02246 family)
MHRGLYALSMCLVAAPCVGANCELAASDRKAVQAMADEYVAAWLANDKDRVLVLLADDAVLMPDDGAQPQLGKTAAEAFWFPAGHPPSTIETFDARTLDIQGCGDMAAVRGRISRLEWSYGGERSRNMGGNFVTIYRKQTNGRWLLSWQIWNSLPAEQVQADAD